MTRYLAKRVALAIPTLFIVSLVAFFLIYLTPGDPVEILLSGGGTVVDEQAAAQLRAELGLDRPLPVQYLDWLGGIFTGDWGVSISSDRPVLEELGRRLPASAWLACVALALTLAISLPAGILAARYRHRLPDAVVRVGCFIASSAPGFLVAMLLVYVFAIRLHALPSVSGATPTGWVLPVATLVICESAVVTRQVRALAARELARDYVLAASLRGVSDTRLLGIIVLKAMAPGLITYLALVFDQLIGGTAIIETVFSWPGLGSYAVDAVLARDYPVIQGYVLLVALLCFVLNLIADLAHAALDPAARAGHFAKERA